MRINYIKKVNDESDGYGYELKEIELCCKEMKQDLIKNLINMSQWNPYKKGQYYLGLVNGDNRVQLNSCPHCGKPVILNSKNETFDLDDTDDIVNIWDEFFPYDFNEGERFYNCKYEK